MMENAGLVADITLLKPEAMTCVFGAGNTHYDSPRVFRKCVCKKFAVKSRNQESE